MADRESIAVVGAGLAGSMAALMLAKRGYSVDLYEKRPDFRISERKSEGDSTFGQSTDSLKRSINLALSFRGQEALRAVGVLDEVMASIVPMPARGVHDLAGNVSLQPYGRPGQFICSASRSLLNRVLLDACDTLPNVRCHFEASIRSLDADNNMVVTLRDGATRTLTPRLVIGADGAYSSVRTSMLRHVRMDYARTYIDHAYKELTMPPTAAGDWAMPQPHALHIWPRHAFMMIALPNPDKTFTCTLFLPWRLFETLDAETAAWVARQKEGGATGNSAVREFFLKHFPDTLALIPGLEAQFTTNPTSALVMTKTGPWNHADRQLLIGDAAHSVVPFYGQGANAAFEDCLCLCEALDACNGDLSAAVPRFAQARKPQTDALAQLSLENYIEMRHKTAVKAWLVRRKVDGLLSALLPRSWVPLYSMVAFTRIPYDAALERSRRQERVLDWLMYGGAAAVGGAAVAAAAKLLPRLLESAGAGAGGLLAAVAGRAPGAASRR